LFLQFFVAVVDRHYIGVVEVNLKSFARGLDRRLAVWDGRKKMRVETKFSSSLCAEKNTQPALVAIAVLHCSGCLVAHAALSALRFR
jgi:hypothetical protein